MGLALALIATDASTRAVAGPDAELLARIQAEAPPTWEAYRRANRFAQGILRVEASAPEAPPYRGEIELKANEASRLLRITNGLSGSSEVLARNSQYCFRLRSGRDGSWVLVEHVLRDEQHQGRVREIENQLDLQGFAQVDQAVRFNPDKQFLGDVLFSSRCRITSTSRKRHDEKDVIELEYELTPNPDEPRQLLGGTLLLDPNRSWLPVVQTSRVRNNVGTGVYTTEFEYGTGINPLPTRVIERAEYTLKSQADPWRATWTAEYDLSIPEDLPDDHEFTLSEFGLPEPVGVTWAKPTPRYIWFLIGAGVFGVLAVGLRYLGRRRTATSA